MRFMEKKHTVYFVKRPSAKEKRASFSIWMKHTPAINGKRYEKYSDERIEALNQNLRSGNIPLETISAEINRICSNLNIEQKKKELGVWVASSDNLVLLEEYWEKEYSDRKIRRPKTAHSRLIWAMSMIGPTPLLGDRKVLQKTVDERCKGNPRRQRRLCAALNQMRRWHGITKDRLRPEKKTRPRFRYHKEKEFLKALSLIDDWRGIKASTLRALFKVLFYSGVRTGEAFALKPHHLKKRNYLSVLTQIDRFEEECPTKNGKERRTVLFDGGVEAFHIWVEAEEKRDIDRTGLSKLLKAACKKAFPNNPDKWVTPHDLRHSFAVMCLMDYDISIDKISKLLGNTLEVCQNYYLNFVPDDEMLESVIRKVRLVG